jgi:6-phosphogluconolactonase/glucosamine-6-phosphate isomerase/deaminase
MARLTVAGDQEGVAEIAAERVTALVENAIAVHGSAVVCLTGGRTPRRLYELLADQARPWRQRIDWTRIHLFWGDERHVPPDHPDSNVRMAHRALAAHVPIPPAHVHRITLTPRALLDARAILVIVVGKAKAAAVHAALEAPEDVARWPVHLLRLAGDRVEWIVDRSTATMT